MEETVEGDGMEQEDCEDEGGQISFHALKGGSAGRIIQVKGQVGKKRLAVLIDSDNTHSFLNKAIVVDLNCKMTDTVPLSVTVANGNKMYSHHKCCNFTWVMQGVEFMADLRVLELGGCDIVLGVDWMKTVSPLTFDFNKLEVMVDVEGRKLTLVGNVEQGECKLISGKRLQKLIQKNSGQITHLYFLRGMEEEDQVTDVEAELKLLMNEVTPCDNLHLLLTEFKDLFLEPTSLPPQRPFDHSIHIKPNAEPVNVRSYLYAPIQKIEIEKQVKDMMAHSLI